MVAATQYPQQYSKLQQYPPQPVVEAAAVAAATAEVKTRPGSAKLAAVDVLWAAALGLAVAVVEEEVVAESAAAAAAVVVAVAAPWV